MYQSDKSGFNVPQSTWSAFNAPHFHWLVFSYSITIWLPSNLLSITEYLIFDSNTNTHVHIYKSLFHITLFTVEGIRFPLWRLMSVRTYFQFSILFICSWVLTLLIIIMSNISNQQLAVRRRPFWAPLTASRSLISIYFLNSSISG